MPENLVYALQNIGLEGKEAKVYFAVLELGPSPVQQIAQRAGISRATTYLVLGSLKNKGLVTTFEKGKKTFFVAESPEQLAQLITGRAAEVRKQEQLLKHLLPTLKATGQFAGAVRPAVRFYEGPEALKALIRDNLKHAGKETLGIFSSDDAERLLERAHLTWDDLVTRRKRAGIRRRVIYTWRKTKPPPGRVRENAVYIPYAEFPCTADVTIVGDRVALVPYDEPIRTVAIEDAAIASAFRAIFDALWKHTK